MTPFDSPDFDDHEAVHFYCDPASGLEAIIALHSSALGPSAGGCRYWRYDTREAGLTDALRLSRGMSYKNALADLPFGGGKAVILRNEKQTDRRAVFEAFGRAVDSLEGRYITAEDVGTHVEDMQAIDRMTRYVSGIVSEHGVAGGDPSPKTAYGVFLGLRETWRHVAGSEDLRGVRVAVQGVGGVGGHLCAHLEEAGAKLVVADLNKDLVQRVVDEHGAVAVAPTEILHADVEILAPCALGAVLNADTIPKLRARAIAGGANNQLATDADGLALAERGITYAPDYVVNAGGIISVASEYLGRGSEEEVRRKIERIPLTLRAILEAARDERLPTAAVADRLARERIAAARRPAAAA
ncbi:MAG TPA: Glu/Leu/Phe/Val dehydrogenase dimerization domain-containing protein [Steroidobacteraceae bacterium]|nr:Glu/Leu/Phe/Val dehydrogenase dimerization domain-containing protein [Steroidobacteraceae bacterium]